MNGLATSDRKSAAPRISARKRVRRGQDRAGVAAGRQLGANGRTAQAARVAAADHWPLGLAHFAPKAKAVIHLFMAGAPSQLDLFDYKPKLAEFEGKPIPPEVIGGQRYAFIRSGRGGDGAAVQVRQARQSRRRDRRRSCRIWPNVVDDICLVRSMHTDQFNHAPAQIFFNTRLRPARPAQHGLVGHLRTGGRNARAAGIRRHVDRQRHQRRRRQLVERLLADRLYGRAVPQSRRSDPRRVEPGRHRSAHAARNARPGRRAEPAAIWTPWAIPEIATRIASYEMAFRLQTSAPELMDLKQRIASHARDVRRRSRPSPHSPGRACWRGAWSNGACGSSASITKAGTPTATSWATTPKNCGDTDRGVGRAGEGSEAARAAGRNAGASGAASSAARRWSRATGPGPQPGPRPSSAGLHHVAGRRRHQARHQLWPDRRAGLQRRREPGPRSRPAGDDPATSSGSITSG